MKKIKKILIIVAIIVVAVLLIKDVIIKAAIVNIGSNVVGARLDVGSFSSNLFTQKVRIKNIRLYNPSGFPKEHLIDIPEVGVDYNLGAFLGGKIHLPVVILNVNEMVIVKNEQGALNVDSLKVVKEAKAPKKDDKDRSPGAKEEMDMKIDLLKLNFNQVVYKDYSQGAQPTIQVYPIDLKNKTFENIQSPEQMVTLVLVQGMQQTAIKGAAIYAAAAMTGVGLIPAGIVGALTGNADSEADFKASAGRVYDVAFKTVKAMGDVKTENKSGGVIKAKVSGADVSVDISEKSRGVTRVVVTAKQFMLPKPEIAGGIIYKMKEELK